MEGQNGTNVITEITALIREWEDSHTLPNFYPVPILMKLAERIEIETENYLKMDPDPFDERHPSRSDPDCKLGHILKVLFRKDNFMTKLLNDYLRDTYYSRLGIPNYDVDELNIVACRLMLDILPGLETSVVFQPMMDGFLHRLIKWATNSVEPLQSYATGLLAAAMEIPEIATVYREYNTRLVPLMLLRLKTYQSTPDTSNAQTTFVRPFAHLSNSKSSPQTKTIKENGHVASAVDASALNSELITEHKKALDDDSYNEDGRQRRVKRMKLDENDVSFTPPSCSPSNRGMFSETSNSSWAELETYLIGNVQLHPPTLATKQILILRYLTPMGEYQEFLGHVFENNVVELILRYVNVRETKEARLAFEALKYLAAVLCHKKFSIEFVQSKGLECLLDVPRPSIAATGVSICLYYLGYCEEAMERICLLPKYIVSRLVRYALWLLECSHDSGRCHATMFFGLTFQFRVILEEFDEQDGLRKLHNVISTLPILSREDAVPNLNEDAECSARQIVRHVCVAYKKYLEAHLYIKAEQLRRSQLRPNERSHVPTIPAQPSYKACKSSPEEIQRRLETLLQALPYRAHWLPVDQLLKLGVINLLLKIIAFAYEWNYSGRAETVRCALDVLGIACVVPKVLLLFCDRIDLPEEAVTVGVNIILGAAEGEIVADTEVQKAALRVIVNCVCAPIHRQVGATISRFSSGSVASPSKKIKMKSSEELLEKVWDSVRSNNGIMVLMQLMNTKTPITDADCIRTLACKALAGLARSDTVRQIVSKLPLFTNGQLHTLMRDPILQEQRQQHVSFQKHALELLGALSGKAKHTGSDLEVSLGNIHKANIVAQTKIHFNDKQLLQLIHQHLTSKGLHHTASALIKEASLVSSVNTTNTGHPPVKFRYISSSVPSRTRLSFSSPNHNRTTVPFNSPAVNHIDDILATPSSSTINGATSSTIRIKKKSVPPLHNLTPVQKPSLQKQLPGELNIKSVSLVSANEEQSRVTLDSVITEYLTNQHALCKNPMSTCPPFNLFVPHKCPDPKPKIHTANNFAIRVTRRQIGYDCKSLDRKLVHNRFCPVQTVRPPTDDGFYTTAKFLAGDQTIIAGTYSGDVRVFNIYNGHDEMVFTAHNSYVVYLEPRRDGKLLITCSSWGRPLARMWSLNNYETAFPFNEDEHLEFSKLIQDRLVGTKGEIAVIYDVNNGQSISQFTPTASNQYTRNKATFSYRDDLILSDGVLFDINSGKQIHKLDKLNQTQSGVFHPNGLEIVSNTEVWDMRTFKLLKTVPVLNQCQVFFSIANGVIYAIALEQEVEDGPNFESSFKTVDALDYSSIATIDVKRNIYDLAINGLERQIAVVENQGAFHTPQESVIRIYDVGRRRDDEDEVDEEDEEDEDMGGSEEEHSEGGLATVEILDVGNGPNNENDEDGNEPGSNGSDGGSWTDTTESSDSTNDSSDEDLSVLDNILFM